jgi:primosomal protein N' (replication factor Y)
VETVAAVTAGAVSVVRAPRAAERAAAPLVETVPPEAEDRSARLGAVLRGTRSAALIVSRRGYGVARVCRRCRRPAACGACRGPIVVERGVAACRVCGAAGRCVDCGGTTFGVERGGVERVAEWARQRTPSPVVVAGEGAGDGSDEPGEGRVMVGTAAAVKDLGGLRLDLVAILDPDRALARPGLHAGEQALATWMEAAAWAGPKGGGGRVLVQTRRPGDPAVQALVRWEPERFLLAEGARRAEAGFPPNHPVFRIAGPPAPGGGGLEAALAATGPAALLVSSRPEGTVCLVTVRPEASPGFREEVMRLAARGLVLRVEAEPAL